MIACFLLNCLIEVAGAAGLEPTRAGVKVPCLTSLATPQQSGRDDNNISTIARSIHI